MSKISLNKLNLEKTTKTTDFIFEKQEIKVLNYLPVKEKVSLISIAIQESIEGTIINPLILDANFHVFVLLMYTNITLTEAQKKNILDTYDLLEKNGLLLTIIEAIPANEYSDLVEALEIMVEKKERVLNSLPYLIKENMDVALNLITERLSEVNLDSDNIKNVLAIAKDNGAL